MARLETRAPRIAEALLAEGRSVRPLDVLVGLGWLAQPNTATLYAAVVGFDQTELVASCLSSFGPDAKR